MLYNPTCKTINPYLWCFALGHFLLRAFLNPVPPSDTTTLGSAIFGDITHISQNLDVFLLKGLPPPDILLCTSLLNSQFKNYWSCLVSLSIFGVNANLQDLQNHLWVPDFILPCFIHLQLQMGQLTCFIIYSSKNTDSKEDIPRFSIEIPIF